MATLWENQSHISHQKYYQTCMDGVDLMSHKKKQFNYMGKQTKEIFPLHQPEGNCSY